MSECWTARIRECWKGLGFILIAMYPPAADASVTAFANQAAFEAALSREFTLVNLDDQPLVGFTPPYHVEDAGPAAAFAQLGIDFQVFDAEVNDGQAFQIALPGRDRLILNGVGGPTGGDLVIDLVDPVHGFGAWSNDGDGGHVRAFSQPRLGGTLIGEADLGSGSFGGLVSTDLIRSVEITCEFNFDLECGVFDIQFGTTWPPVPIPPWAAITLSVALPWLGVLVLRRGLRAA